MPEETQKTSEEEQTTENTQDTETESSSSEQTEYEYKRKTLYFRNSTKREFEQWLNRMELEHNIAFEAEKRQQHEALIHVAMNNQEEFLEKLEDIMG